MADSISLPRNALSSRFTTSMNIFSKSNEDDEQIQALLNQKIQQSKIVHEVSFYVGLVFTTIFYWNLGGGALGWSLLFASLGFVIDFTKKTQLELSAFTKERWPRWRKKTLALILTGVSLLGSLGASLTRASAVTSEEAFIQDTSALESRVQMANTNVAMWQEILRKYPYDFVKARSEASSKVDQYLSELTTAQRELMTKKTAIAGTESRTDMFSLLARFFNIRDYQTFMVILLMIGAAGIDLSFWVTMPQYWKKKREILPAFEFEKEIKHEKAPAQSTVEAVKPPKAPELNSAKKASLF